jgi:hypothetical protein
MASFVNRRTLSGEDFLSFFRRFHRDPVDRRLQLHRFVSHILVATTGCTSQLSRVGTAWSLEQTVAQP